MSHPSFLTIRRVACEATEDLIGSDDLAGVIGLDRFTIGRFNDGESANLDLRRAIAPGSTTLKILEEDFEGDDTLTTIDLTQDMDVERQASIRFGRASYEVFFTVTSEPD